jgi:hypothetical protein
MAKKFAEITGIHKIFNPVTISGGPNDGTTIYQGMTITDSELKENIDENTIVFVTADDTDVNRIIGPNNYKISKNDCFIVAQNKVYATFGKVNVSDVMGPAGENGLTPHIDPRTGNWFIGTEDTEVHAQGSAGENGLTPHIDPRTGNWFIGTEDTEVHARGEKGENGETGAGAVPDLMGLENNQYKTFQTNTLVKGDYGISTDGDVWIYDGSKLEKSEVNLKGPKGDDGTPGQQGPPGDSSGGTGGTVEIKDSLPIGAITMYAGGSDPIPGWLLCNGAKYKLKSVSTINIPGHGPEPDGEELFTTVWGGEPIRWQIADKGSEYVGDLLKVIKNTYGWDTPRNTPY